MIRNAYQEKKKKRNAYQCKIHIKNIFTPQAKQKQKQKQN